MNERIKALATKIRNNWDLCGSQWGNCEAETIFAQTIHAACINLEKRGEPFSIRGAGLDIETRLARNASTYRTLVNDGFLREETRDLDGEDAAVIFLTDKALDALEAHVAKNERGA